MEVPIRVPDLGNEISEAQVEEWLVAVGDKVTEGEQILVVMTPKAAVEIDAPATGILKEITVAVDELVESGALVIALVIALVMVPVLALIKAIIRALIRAQVLAPTKTLSRAPTLTKMSSTSPMKAPVRSFCMVTARIVYLGLATRLRCSIMHVRSLLIFPAMVQRLLRQTRLMFGHWPHLLLPPLIINRSSTYILLGTA